MHLSRERDRVKGCPGQQKPPPAPAPGTLERPERQGDQHRDRPEEMADALFDAIGRDREREPAYERGSARQPELAQPRARRQSGEAVDEDLQDVPAADETEYSPQWPEEQAEGPAGIVRLWHRFGPERIGIPPRSVAVLQLVPDEPVVVQRLQVVARRGLAVRGGASGQEVRAGVQDRGPGGCDRSRQVQRGTERYIACAARSSS